MSARGFLLQPMVLALPALVTLGGCATFGGNVRGSFSCAAPDGICAPSSSIDDRALAMIAGESGGGDATPAGPYLDTRAKPKGSRTAADGPIVPVVRGDAQRTQERVLRIVFQPYIDARGRLHEASAVHAVVQTGDWQQRAIASATQIPDRSAAASGTAPVSLADAVDRADPMTVDVAGIDPNLPDPAVVAAARARSLDPVAAIKSDVAARLAPKAGRSALVGPPPAPKGETAGAGPLTTGKMELPPTGAGGVVAVEKSKIGGQSDVPAGAKTSVGVAAIARVKESPQYKTRAADAETAARNAPGVAPADKLDAKPVVRATGFPATVPEEN